MNTAQKTFIDTLLADWNHPRSTQLTLRDGISSGVLRRFFPLDPKQWRAIARGCLAFPREFDLGRRSFVGASTTFF